MSWWTDRLKEPSSAGGLGLVIAAAARMVTSGHVDAESLSMLVGGIGAFSMTEKGPVPQEQAKPTGKKPNGLR